MYTWPLSTSTFDLWDKLKIAKWILTTPKFTMGEQVEKFEKKMSELSGMHALAVSSGSTANQLVFELLKHKNPDTKFLVVVPSVTWSSSITPCLMAGMDIEFCDVNIVDFCFDYGKLKEICERNKNRRIVIWPTALIGFYPDFDKLRQIAREYNAELYLDACENTLSRKNNESILSEVDISTTSMYWSHQISSPEFGFVFFRSHSDYLLGKMFRNHGMTRSLPVDNPQRLELEKKYSHIDPQFLFALPGTNFRNTDVHATFGLIDFDKHLDANLYKMELLATYCENIDTSKYYNPIAFADNISGFCLPIFAIDAGLISKIKAKLADLKIEYRPIIGGCLLNQPIFEKYGKCVDFPNANWIHNHGIYVGLHKDVSHAMLIELIDELNSL